MTMPAAAMNCPVCSVPLVMSERQNVEIDYCPQCRGVWLDRGELDKIIERAGSEQQKTAPPQQAPVQTGYSQLHGKPHYPKRRKSFLEELFD
jgi:Zn-finger nucleic acid-binding protein